MFKLLLLQMYEGATDRQAVERMAFDLRWKAALGLEIGDPAVGQATLVGFRARLQLHGKMGEVFGRFVKRAMDVGVLRADEVQVLDLTALAAALVVNPVRMATLLGDPVLSPHHRDQLAAQIAVSARLISRISAVTRLANTCSYHVPCHNTHRAFRSDSWGSSAQVRHPVSALRPFRLDVIRASGSCTPPADRGRDRCPLRCDRR